MDAISAIKKRRSVRSFSGRNISKKVIENIVSAGGFAATARNVQPWEFIIVTDKKKLQEIAGITENGKFIAECPVCIAVFCSDTKYYLEDGCAATENILIAATAYGLGSCWVAGDKKPYCQDIGNLLGVAGSLKLVSLIAIGYPKDKAVDIPKRDLKSIMHWEKL